MHCYCIVSIESNYIVNIKIIVNNILLCLFFSRQLEERGNYPSTSMAQSVLKTNTNVQERTPLLKPGARVI